MSLAGNEATREAATANDEFVNFAVLVRSASHSGVRFFTKRLAGSSWRDRDGDVPLVVPVKRAMSAAERQAAASVSQLDYDWVANCPSPSDVCAAAPEWVTEAHRWEPDSSGSPRVAWNDSRFDGQCTTTYSAYRNLRVPGYILVRQFRAFHGVRLECRRLALLQPDQPKRVLNPGDIALLRRDVLHPALHLRQQREPGLRSPCVRGKLKLPLDRVLGRSSTSPFGVL